MFAAQKAPSGSVSALVAEYTWSELYADDITSATWADSSGVGVAANGNLNLTGGDVNNASGSYFYGNGIRMNNDTSPILEASKFKQSIDVTANLGKFSNAQIGISLNAYRLGDELTLIAHTSQDIYQEKRQGTAGAVAIFYRYIDPDWFITFQVRDAVGAAITITHSAAVSLTTWYEIKVGTTPNQVHLEVNGVLESLNVSNFSLLPGPIDKVRIVGHPNDLSDRWPSLLISGPLKIFSESQI